MSKAVMVIVLFASAFVTSISPAHAAGRLVAQKVTKSTGGLYLSLRLIAGHHYRVDVGAPTHSVFSGMGGENYTYVSHQRLFTATKPFQLKGTTPKSFTVRQRVHGDVTGWILYMDVSLARGKAVSLRVFDLGTK